MARHAEGAPRRARRTDADRDEVYEAGDAYYAPPGHIPVVTAGTEVVEFSPTEAYRQTMAEVVEASRFLLENAAVNGLNLPVDGGWLCM